VPDLHEGSGRSGRALMLVHVSPTSSEKKNTRQPPSAYVVGSAFGLGHAAKLASLRQLTSSLPGGENSSTTSGSTQYPFVVFVCTFNSLG
jgi:hypothetical protein